MPTFIGARWDLESQDARFIQAKSQGLLDYVEVNYPIAANVSPEQIGLPIIPHTSNNPLCSAHGIDFAVAQQVKNGITVSDLIHGNSKNPEKNPFNWVGEHLAWLNMVSTGTLGYVINPVFTKDFKEVTVQNIYQLKKYYNRPLALELGPVYGLVGDYESEMHFLGDVAKSSDSYIILDVTHWQISNHNLQRDTMFGLDALDKERIVELHVAGVRQSSDGKYWHDAHQNAPDQKIISIVKELSQELPNLKAITLEHHADGNEKDFYQTLEYLKAS